jgi:tetratricopeptide (TPR) repeat protein
MKTTPVPFLALLLLLVSCGGLPSYRDYPATRVSLSTGGSGGPEVDELVELFFDGDGFDPAELDAVLEAALEAHPADAAVHEVAGHYAVLRADGDRAFDHFLAAARDGSSHLTGLYLDLAMRRVRTARMDGAAIATLEALFEEDPRPDVRFDAGYRLVPLLEEREQLAAASRVGDRLGLIRAFRLAGAFDNDQGRGFNATHPPEQGIDFDAEMPGLRIPVRWRVVDTFDRRGRVPLDDLVSPDDHSTAYLVTHVRSPEARDVQLRISTSTPSKVWVNGGIVLAQERLAGGAADNLVLPIRLDAGWNRILIKSAQDAGAWYLGARITDASGSNLEDLAFDADAHEVEAREIGEPGGVPSPLEEPLDALVPPLRRDLMWFADSVRNGFDSDALARGRAMLEHGPRHPVSLYYAARAHLANEQAGEAIDLLNAGVDTTGSWGGGFLIERGRFYRDRRRYDRALEDLRAAAEAVPESRVARLELASTYAARSWAEERCRALAAVLETWPDSARAERSLGDCFQDRGYLDQAEEHYRRAHALEPGNGWTLRRLALLSHWRQDDAAAEAFARDLVRIFPWSVDARVAAGDYARYGGRRDVAEALYREALAQDPAWSVPYGRLGRMAAEEGRREEAVAVWTEALARDPDDQRLAERVDYLREQDGNGPDPRLPSESDIERAIAEAASLELDPGAQTVLILDDEVTTVQNDGSSTRRVTQVSVAATTDGRDALIANRVPRNARVLQAFSVSPDGERQEASSIRGGIIRFRGLDVGSRVVLQYTYQDAPPVFLPNHFVSSWLFQGIHRQLVDARWVVEVPRGRELAMHVQGPVEHGMETVGAMDVHTFTARGVEPLVPEPGMPPASDLLALVQISTLTSWDEYAEWERALLAEVFESNREVAALAQRLTADATTPRERLDRLFHYVAEEIRYQQDYETTIAGVRPHSCPVVLERGYGDCKDKAVLLILLAREVGLDVDFAILRTRNAGAVRREVPNQQFNHAIVYVPVQEGIEEGFFMDPTTDGLDMGNLRSDDQGTLSLVLDPETGRHRFIDIPYQGPERQNNECDIAVAVTGAEAATAEVRCSLRGDVASQFRRVMRTADRAQQLRQNLANNLFPGSSVREAEERHVDDIWNPVEYDLDLDVAPALQPEGEARRIRIPSPFGLARITRLETRRTPLRLGVPSRARWEIRVEAPRGGRILRSPEDFEVVHECFEVRRTRTVRGRRVTLAMEQIVRCPEVDVEAYPEFRRLAQQAANAANAEVVLAL